MDKTRIHQTLVGPYRFAIIEFESQDDKTLLNWYKLYETKELFEMIEKHHKTSEGFKQTAEKLNTYLNQNKSKLL